MSDLTHRRKRRHPYQQLPNWRIRGGELTAYEKLVAIWLASHRGTHVEKLSRNAIAEDMDLSGPTITRALQGLERAGIISVEWPQGGGRRLKIVFDWDVWEFGRQAESGTESSSSGADSEPRTGTESSATGTESSGCEQPHLYLQEDQVTNQHTVPEPTSAELFESFWKAYPNKQAKPDARRAWNAMMRRKAPLDIVRSGFKAWANYWAAAGTLPHLIPHPASWLNKERYNDAPPPVPSGRFGNDPKMSATELHDAAIAILHQQGIQ